MTQIETKVIIFILVIVIICVLIQGSRTRAREIHRWKVEAARWKEEAMSQKIRVTAAGRMRADEYHNNS